MSSLSAVVCLVLLAFAAATEVNQCPETSSSNTNIELSPCKKPPCRLKKGSMQHISIKFTPEKEKKDVKNKVGAVVFGVPLPFVGVDGTSICDKIFTESGERTSCPLKAGTPYVYKDSFPILSIYPTLAVEVFWKLQGDDKKEFVCFNVPARIQ